MKKQSKIKGGLWSDSEREEEEKMHSRESVLHTRFKGPQIWYSTFQQPPPIAIIATIDNYRECQIQGLDQHKEGLGEEVSLKMVRLEPVLGGC